MRTVVFDATGVLYNVPSGDYVGELLIPFLREQGVKLSDDATYQLYRQAMLGELSVGGLWASCGLARHTTALDSLFLARFRLVDGIVSLLTRLTDQNVTLGCITNDVGEWSRALRQAHGLERWIDTWTVSSEVGARKPDERIFRAFLSQTGCAPQECVLVDDRATNVEAAARIGFVPVLVDFGGKRPERPAVRGVEELASRLDGLLGGGALPTT